jgi:hypothetical protein
MFKDRKTNPAITTAIFMLCLDKLQLGKEGHALTFEDASSSYNFPHYVQVRHTQ